MSSNNALKLIDTKEQTLEMVAKEYKNIKAQIEALEESLKPFKSTLEEAALAAPDMKLDLDGYKVILSEVSRENFDLKTAKIKLGVEIVAPFVKVSNYTQLRVTVKE